jgi:hypothetical protein
MILVALIFVFYALLAVVYELREMTARLIEIGTVVENFNRRDLRASIKDHDDDDFASESITKTQRTWRQIVAGIVVSTIATLLGMKVVDIFLKH